MLVRDRGGEAQRLSPELRACVGIKREQVDILGWLENEKKHQTSAAKTFSFKFSKTWATFFSQLRSQRVVSIEAPRFQSQPSTEDDDKAEALTSNNVIHLLQGSL